jgi:hypothetical protein
VLSDVRECESPEERWGIYMFGAGSKYADLFEAVGRKLERSNSRIPRAIFVIMINVEARAVIEKCPLFTEVAVGGALTTVVLGSLGSLRVFATAEGHISR